MPTSAETFAEAQKHLQAGDIQGAADLLAKAEADEKAEADAKAGIKPPPPPLRAPDLVLLDFMEAMASRFGHHRELETLVAEMKASLAELHDAATSSAKL